MNHSINFAVELDQTDENFFYEVSDETLEAAAGIEGQSLVTIGPTIMVGGCCCSEKSEGEFHYVIRSTYEDHERVAREGELKRA
jgi:hypothetical protein